MISFCPEIMVKTQPNMLICDPNQRSIAQNAQEGTDINRIDMVGNQEDKQDHGHRNQKIN